MVWMIRLRSNYLGEKMPADVLIRSFVVVGIILVFFAAGYIDKQETTARMKLCVENGSTWTGYMQRCDKHE